MTTYTAEIFEAGRWLTLPGEHKEILPARQAVKSRVHDKGVFGARVIAQSKDGEKVVDEWTRDTEGRVIRISNMELNPDVNHTPKEMIMAKAKAAAAATEADLLGEVPVQTTKKGKAKDVPAPKSVADDLLGEEPKKAKKGAAKKAAAPKAGAKPKETIEQRNERLRRQAQAMKERAAAKREAAAAEAAAAEKVAAKAAKASKKAA